MLFRNARCRSSRLERSRRGSREPAIIPLLLALVSTPFLRLAAISAKLLFVQLLASFLLPQPAIFRSNLCGALDETKTFACQTLSDQTHPLFA